jgi:hypothetical protein
MTAPMTPASIALTHVGVEEGTGGLDAQSDDPALIDAGLEDVTAAFTHGVILALSVFEGQLVVLGASCVAVSA